MWTMPVPSSSVTSSHGITRCSTPCLRREVVERPLVAEADELLAARALDELLSTGSVAPRATQSPFSRWTYSASGFTAAATFAGSVHGVVVQTTSDSPSRLSSSGKRTKSDGCVISSYESISSCCESDVPQRGHHSTERWPT